MDVRAMFDRVAPRYDLLNRLLSARRDLGWRRRVARAVPSEARFVVDLFAGTADLALAAAAARPRAGVIACDFSLRMLHLARGKLARRAEGARVALLCADCTQLPLPDGVADAVTGAFGLRYLGDLPAGLQEMRRVLRPGGLVAQLDFCPSRRVVLGWFQRLMWQHVIPRVGDALSPARGAYRHFAGTVEGARSQEEVCAAMREAGLIEVSYADLSGGICTLFTGRRPAAGGMA